MKHEYWGKKRGTNHPILGLCIKGKRASAKKVENRGPTGWKARKERPYANKRLK